MRGGEARGEAPALVLEGVHKSFGEEEVLKGIDLIVEPHEVVCLIGASGSGKSTLLKCVNLTEPVDSGRIVVDGEEITAPSVNVNGSSAEASNWRPLLSLALRSKIQPVYRTESRLPVSAAVPVPTNRSVWL